MFYYVYRLQMFYDQGQKYLSKRGQVSLYGQPLFFSNVYEIYINIYIYSVPFSGSFSILYSNIKPIK